MNLPISQRSSRLKAIHSTTAAAAIAKGITAAVQLTLVPITLGYLNQQTYGVWMTISATVAFLQISDLGLGNALISLTAHQRVAGGYDSVIVLLKKGLVISVLIAMIILSGGFAAIEYLNWKEWLSIPEDQKTQAHDAMLACLLMFCVLMPSTLANQIRLGLMKGYSNSIFQSLGQLLNLLFVWIGVLNRVDLASIVVLSTLGSLFGNVINLTHLLIKYRGAGSSLFSSNVSQISFSKILARGFPFFILQVAGIFISQSDVLIVSHYLGPDKVTDYSVSMRYFSVPILILSFYLYSVWPAYADAEARGDWAWIGKFFFASLKKSIIFNLLLASLFLGASFWVLPWWTHGKVVADPILVILLTLFVTLNAIGGNLSSFMNGLHLLKLQVTLSIMSGVATLFLSLWLTPKIGLSGPIASFLVVNSIAYVIMYMNVRKHLAIKLSY